MDFIVKVSESRFDFHTHTMHNMPSREQQNNDIAVYGYFLAIRNSTLVFHKKTATMIKSNNDQKLTFINPCLK